MDRQKLVAKLNEDLSNELAAIIQYITYAARVTGPYRPQLVDFLLKEVADEQSHAQFLANKVVALGGVPTTKAAPVAAAETNKELLEAVLEAERKAVAGYKERAEQADEFGDVGLKVQLEDMVRDETEHAEQVERILRDWQMALA
jgi:bacterioferritin